MFANSILVLVTESRSATHLQANIIVVSVLEVMHDHWCGPSFEVNDLSRHHESTYACQTYYTIAHLAVAPLAQYIPVLIL